MTTTRDDVYVEDLRSGDKVWINGSSVTVTTTYQHSDLPHVMWIEHRNDMGDVSASGAHRRLRLVRDTREEAR